MHEQRIVHKIIEEAEKQGKVSSLVLEVGELNEITPEELGEHLKEHVSWKINVKERKSKIECKCSYRGRAEILDRGHDYCLFRCPKCHNKPRVIEGGEIKIIQIK